MHTGVASAAGTSWVGSLEYRNVVERCIGGATSVTRFKASSACKERVEAPMASLEWDMIKDAMFGS